MSNAIKCEAGNGKGKFYHRGPSGQIVLSADKAANKAKTIAGWRLATQTEIDAAAKAETDRRAGEAKANAPAHVERVRDAAAQASMAAKVTERKEARNARDPE